ncbi:hypothetical protein GCM10027605_22180 [Micromonospora zhanjiangensis]
MLLHKRRAESGTGQRDTGPDLATTRHTLIGMSACRAAVTGCHARVAIGSRLNFAEAVHGCETAAVSWSLFVVPLDGLSRDGMSDWIASAEFTRGIPEQAPQALPRLLNFASKPDLCSGIRVDRRACRL